jgi:hypothetical protein
MKMKMTQENGLMYKNGDWGIFKDYKDRDTHADVLHNCNRKDKIGLHIEWSYQSEGDVFCPGCGERQPDDIQTLWALYTLDKPDENNWGRSYIRAADLKVVNDEHKRLIRMTFKKYQ